MADLVFIHGAGDSSEVWDNQVDYFSGQHHVLAVDLPGHGQRLMEPAHARHEANAREVVQQIELHGMQEPVIVGHSMGGAVALPSPLSAYAQPAR